MGLNIYNVKAIWSKAESMFELKQTKFSNVHLLRLLPNCLIKRLLPGQALSPFLKGENILLELETCRLKNYPSRLKREDNILSTLGFLINENIFLSHLLIIVRRLSFIFPYLCK